MKRPLAMLLSIVLTLTLLAACSLCVTIPPLGAVFFAGKGEWQKEKEPTSEPSEV